jgi:hypothetical protein
MPSPPFDTAFNFLGTIITDVGTWFSGLFDTYFAAKTTDNLTEGVTNRYYSDAFARGAISENVTGLEYSSSTGVLSQTAGYVIPLSASTTQWTTAFNWGNHATAGYLSTTSGNWTGTFDGQEGTFYLSRANHTGTQLASTISDLVAAIQASSVGTSTAPTTGQVAFWSGPRTLGSTATGTLTESVTGLQFDQTRALLGGSAVLSLTTGFVIPTSTLWSQVADFYQTPSTRITAGTGLSWSGNTLNSSGGTVYLASSSPWTVGSAAFVASNGTLGSVATGTLTETVTGLEFNATRGLFGGSAALALSTGFTIPSTTLITSASSFFATPSSLCTAITGSAALCDGVDDTASGGSGLATTTPWTVGELAQVASQGAVRSIATSSLGLSPLFTTSAGLAALLSDETGTGAAVFAGSPTFTGTSTFAGNLSVAGSAILGTTTTSMLNGMIVVDGVKYPQTGSGIQMALNDAALAGGGVVYLPSATYPATTTIVIPYDPKIRLMGAKRTKQLDGGTIIKASNSLDSLISLSGLAYASKNSDLSHDFYLENVTLDGSNLTTTCFAMLNQDLIIISDFRIISCINGITARYNGLTPMSSSSIPGGLSIGGNQSIIGVTSNAGGAHIILENQTQVSISNLWLSNYSSTSIRIASSTKIRINNIEFNNTNAAIELSDSLTAPTNDITIQNSIFSIGAGNKIASSTLVNPLSNRICFGDGNTFPQGVMEFVDAQSCALVGPRSTINNGHFAFLPDGTGGFGIGTTTPQTLLHVSGFSNTALRIEATNSVLPQLQLFRGNSITSWAMRNNGGNLEFARSLNSYANNVVEMSITTSGNVGVGTTSPSARLTVAGDMRLTGRFADSSSSTGSSNAILTSTTTGTAWVAPNALCVAITGSADLCDGSDSGGAGGTPGGTTGQVQFNNAGAFAGSATLFYNNATNLFGVGTSTPDARLSVVATSTGPIANFFSFVGSLVMSVTDSLVSIFGDLRVTGNLTVEGTVNLPATYRNYVEYFDDFMEETSNAGDAIWGEDISGTGAACTATAIGTNFANRPGMSRCTTGTTFNGRAGLVTSLNSIALGQGTTTFETAVQITNLSVVAQRYVLQAGFFDTNGTTTTDGAYLVYDEGGNSGYLPASANWQCVTASNNVRSTSTSAIAVTDSAVHRLTTVVNAAGTSVSFFVNGTLACTLATNIPTGTARATSHGFQVLKALGTTARTFDVDYNYARIEFTTLR